MHFVTSTQKFGTINTKTLLRIGYNPESVPPVHVFTTYLPKVYFNINIILRFLRSQFSIKLPH
jgi:hypothetical protein